MFEAFDLALEKIDFFGTHARVYLLQRQQTLEGVIGWSYDLLPEEEQQMLRRLGVDGIYLPLETSRPEAVLAMLPQARVRGLSVTAPHKVTMAGQCHRLSAEASAT